MSEQGCYCDACNCNDGLRRENKRIAGLNEVLLDGHRSYLRANFSLTGDVSRLTKLAEAWKAAAEALSIGDCPPLCMDSLGCTLDVCKVHEASKLLRDAREIDGGES